MGKEERDGKDMPPASLPPETGVIDAHWDDDDPIEIMVDEVGDRPDPFSRVTTIPDMPAEEHALRLMAEADRRERGRGTNSGSPPGSLHDRKTPIEYLSPPRVPIFEAPTRQVTPRSDLDALSLDFDDGRFETSDVVVDVAEDEGPEIEIVGPEIEIVGPEIEGPEIEGPESAEPPSDAPLLAAMKDRYAMGDFSGALAIAEGLLNSDAEHAEARRFAESCREVLIQMYSARLGSLGRVASVAIPADQIRWLSLDHRAGFLLSLVDGVSSVEEILDISGMGRLDALRITYTLLEQRVITLHDEPLL